MWIWLQKPGVLRHGDFQRATGYSGHDEGKNKPELQHVPNVGPIPQGAWLIGTPSESKAHGPLALHLVPLTGTNTFGRSGFLCHGDSSEHPGEASEGCIILPRPVRDELYASTDKLLIVLSGNTPS